MHLIVIVRAAHRDQAQLRVGHAEAVEVHRLRIEDPHPAEVGTAVIRHATILRDRPYLVYPLRLLGQTPAATSSSLRESSR